jgi:cell wall-associated NlpC family hydrolase
VALDAPIRTRANRIRQWIALIAALVVATGLVVSWGAPPAQADTIAELEAKINRQWSQLEPTIENYNAVHAKLISQQQKAAKLQTQIQPLELEVTLSKARVGSLSAELYQAGPTGGVATLLDAQDATNALNMLATVEQMATNQQKLVSSTMTLVNKYRTQKKPIDDLVASLDAQNKALASQANTIQASIKSLDQLRIKAWGSTVEPGPTRPVPCPQRYTGDAGSRAAQWACNQIGKRYVWGSAGPNTFDCSGLTMRAWESVGVSLPHNAYQQKHTVRAISYRDLRPGDLVFYYPGISHVTIYVGNGWVVSAPTSGDVVRMKRWNSSTDVRGFGRP